MTVVTTASPKTRTWSEVYDEVAPAVVRFDVAGCEGFGSGSGFLVGDDLIATAAHVVVDSVEGRVTLGTKATAYVVVGVNDKKDVALVWTQTPLESAGLPISDDRLAVGDQVATVGYSLGLNKSFHEGVVNGLNRKELIDGRGNLPVTGLIEHSANALPGDSGAPLMDIDGEVVGVHDAGSEGQRFAVPISAVERLMSNWDGSHSWAFQPPDCDGVFDSRSQTDLLNAWDTLGIRVEAINRGDWRSAAAQYVVPRPKEIRAGSEESEISGLEPLDGWKESGKPVIWATFETDQPKGKGPKGRPNETCTIWSVDYLFGQKNGLWLVSGTRRHGDEPVSRPCEGE